MTRSHGRPHGNKRQNASNMKRIAVIGTLIVVFAAQLACAGSRAHSYSWASHSSTTHRSYSTHRSYPLGVQRDSHGRIKRSSSAKHEFMRTTGYPHGRPGYVVDHVKPLKRGGSDSPSNMQWQTKQAAKAKDKWE